MSIIEPPTLEAYVVNDTHIIVPCPFHRGKKYHIHGSSGRLLNCKTHRSSHCVPGAYPKGYYIKVTDRTERAYIGKSNQILKRGYQELQDLYAEQLSTNN
jgi:hypothetical protein|tara:strand:- start:3658 stop:3957 length:300 start_codon:yes stop_codon:yes gene_type:complete